MSSSGPSAFSAGRGLPLKAPDQAPKEDRCREFCEKRWRRQRWKPGSHMSGTDPFKHRHSDTACEVFRLVLTAHIPRGVEEFDALLRPVQIGWACTSTGTRSQKLMKAG